MRMTVFGATGNVGRRVVDEALARDHEVTTVLRRRGRAGQLPGAARVRIGDADRYEDVLAARTSQDVVIAATRPPQGQEGELVTTTRTMLAALAGSGVRLLVVGGAGGLTVPGAGGRTVLEDPRYMVDAYRDIALANVGQLEACRATTAVDWAYLSPPARLTAGPRTGTYRCGTDELLVDETGDSWISFEDLAVALVDEAERPKHHRTRFTVASSTARPETMSGRRASG